MSEIADIFVKAADRLERTGWTQDVAYRDNDPKRSHLALDESECAACVLGALWSEGEKTDGPATQFLKNYLREWPADWNDAPGRTQEEVVAKLREAAAKAREQGL